MYVRLFWPTAIESLWRGFAASLRIMQGYYPFFCKKLLPLHAKTVRCLKP